MENEILEIIAIDESGITSLIGHSVYAFIHIHIRDYVEISKFIIQIEKDLGLDYIHRHDMSWDIRLKLAKKISHVNFKINAVIHINPIYPDKALELSLVRMFSQMKHSHKIFIDGKKSRQYNSKINRMLKMKGLKIYKVKFVNDISEPTLRLADFVAGSIRSHLDHPTNKKAEIIYKKLESRIENLYKIK